jgi:tRNA dimethylallyltransferase
VNQPLLIVAGPTASGKSALALALADEFSGTIVNADSMQVYRDLAVLTARPGVAEEARAPHRLYGLIDGAENFSAGRWRALAAEAVAEARASGRVPILVGGSGLYLHAFVHGLAAMPAVAPQIRQEARALHAELGGERFRALLLERDPQSARLAAGDTQRLVRAYEVVTATGRALADWQRGDPERPAEAIIAVVLLPPRDALYAGCDARFLAMLARGAEAEVEALMARGLDPALPVMKAVGVREIADWQAGALRRAEMVAAAQQATRRYAKRQYTWLRHRLQEGGGVRRLTIAAQYSESLLPEIFSFIRQ